MNILCCAISVFIGLFLFFLGFVEGIYSGLNKNERKSFSKLFVFKTPFQLMAFLILIILGIETYFL